MKRSFDFIFSVLAIIVLLPLMGLISIIIKITSKGPIVFTQRRIGINKNEFLIYKFRSMYIDTPKNVPTHLLTDPEKSITPIGRILRKSSLDELPQLFNVLNGQMSFVGPRPALYNQKDLIELRVKKNVNSLIPGITGWAQINGRDELPIKEKVEYDLEYLNKRNFLFDIKIMVRTGKFVFCSDGIVEGKRKSKN